MFYYFILAFQGFCIFHLIKNRNEYYWLFLIIFVPVIGCVFYLITQVYSKNRANKIQENLTSIIVPSKKINELKKQLEFSETYQNKVNLANAYVEIKDYKNAISYYEEASKDTSQKTYHCKEQLVVCYYHIENYDLVISEAEKIKQNIEFEKSDAQYIYALALKNKGRYREAETELRKIDQRYSNYDKRLVFAKFLIEQNKKTEAKEVLTEMFNEAKHMKPSNKRINRSVFVEVEKLLKTM